MQSTVQRRERNEVPVVVEAPALSDLAMDLEEDGSGAYRLTDARGAGRGTEAELAVHLGGPRPERFLARVIWVRRNQTFPVTWSIGLALRPDGGERREFGAALRRWASRSMKIGGARLLASVRP